MKNIIKSLIFTVLAVVVFCSFANAAEDRKEIKVGGSEVHYMKTDSSVGALKTYKMNIGKVGDADLFVHFTTQMTNMYNVSVTPFEAEQKVKSRALGIGFNF